MPQSTPQCNGRYPVDAGHWKHSGTSGGNRQVCRSAVRAGLLTFISLPGGFAAFGFIGVVLGPVPMATAISLFRHWVPTNS